MPARILRSLFFAAAFALFAGAAFAADTLAGKPLEEKSLLAPDGTLYTVRSGHISDLNITDTSVISTDNVIAWSFRRPDGSVAQGLVPDTVGQSLKRNLDLAYDESTGSLVLLFKEDLTVLNVLRIGIFRDGGWTMTNLLPNLGFAHAYNPQLLLSHQAVTTQDASGNSVSQTRTILSVIWWEEAQITQARYAPIFIEGVKTVIGASYRPTIVWNTDRGVGYTRFDGRKWSAAITIPLTDTMTYERALRLVQEMATRN